MSSMRLYPIADIYRIPLGVERHNVRAVKIGEFRRPKAGEWYISGAIPEAYYSTGNSLEFHIAKLVEVRQVMTVRVIRDL